ncbi:hypothetical protein L218DRAFT_870316, partial [Marasmius fiardii PR-910]
LYCIDETSKDDRVYARIWGQAAKGMRAQVFAPFVHGDWFSLVAGMVLDEGIRAARVVKGSFTKKPFMNFIHNDVLSSLLHCYPDPFQLPTATPFPGPRSALLIDNARIHKHLELIELVQRHGCCIEFLLPYSPDYMPIELGFNVMKSHLRRVRVQAIHREEQILEFYNIAQLITPEMTWGFF